MNPILDALTGLPSQGGPTKLPNDSTAAKSKSVLQKIWQWVGPGAWQSFQQSVPKPGDVKGIASMVMGSLAPESASPLPERLVGKVTNMSEDTGFLLNVLKKLGMPVHTFDEVMSENVPSPLVVTLQGQLNDLAPQASDALTRSQLLGTSNALNSKIGRSLVGLFQEQAARRGLTGLESALYPARSLDSSVIEELFKQAGITGGQTFAGNGFIK